MTTRRIEYERPILPWLVVGVLLLVGAYGLVEILTR